MRNRMIGALIAGTMVFAAAYALAAPLSVGSDNLGAGTDVVASCDTDGVTTSFTPLFDDPDYRVLNVKVGGLNALCNGETISVTLTNSLGSVIGNGSHLGSGASRTVNIVGEPVASVLPTAADVHNIAVVITGDNI
ncbi:MAG: hypothetical protein ACT4OM_04945 [Actinomycetota bacterium]